MEAVAKQYGRDVIICHVAYRWLIFGYNMLQPPMTDTGNQNDTIVDMA